MKASPAPPFRPRRSSRVAPHTLTGRWRGTSSLMYAPRRSAGAPTTPAPTTRSLRCTAPCLACDPTPHQCPPSACDPTPRSCRCPNAVPFTRPFKALAHLLPTQLPLVCSAFATSAWMRVGWLHVSLGERRISSPRLFPPPPGRRSLTASRT
eukprot:scaffold2267_cov112-Isochrysis_galbana.AAC.6